MIRDDTISKKELGYQNVVEQKGSTSVKIYGARKSQGRDVACSKD